jgi:hypothetical protein
MHPNFPYFHFRTQYWEGILAPIPQIPQLIEINNSIKSRYGWIAYLVNVVKINGKWEGNGMKKPQK